MSVVNSQSATHANVNGSATSVALFAAVSSIKGRSVFNDSTATLYLKFGATASTTSYVTQVASGQLYEFPLPTYAGLVHGIWSSATGAARTTEW